MTEQADDTQLVLDVQDLLAAHAQAATAQIVQLINRVAELEATNAALRRALAARRGAPDG